MGELITEKNIEDYIKSDSLNWVTVGTKSVTLLGDYKTTGSVKTVYNVTPTVDTATQYALYRLSISFSGKWSASGSTAKPFLPDALTSYPDLDSFLDSICRDEHSANLNYTYHTVYCGSCETVPNGMYILTIDVNSSHDFTITSTATITGKIEGCFPI